MSVYDVGYDAGRHYIVMELVEGVTQGLYCKEGGPVAGEAAGFAAQFAPRSNVRTKTNIHRDIKAAQYYHAGRRREGDRFWYCAGGQLDDDGRRRLCHGVGALSFAGTQARGGIQTKNPIFIQPV